MHTRPLIRADLPQIATIAYDAFSSDELYNWLYPGLKQYPNDYRRAQINSLRARLVRPGCHGFVVVDDEGEGEVMGYAVFSRVGKTGDGNEEGKGKWMGDSLFMKLERTLLSITSLYTSFTSSNRAVSPTNLSTYLTSRQHSTALYAALAPYWHVSVVAIAPKFQRRGVGALLVREGQALAKEEGVPVVLETSPAARRLYEKCGFEVWREGRIGGLEDVSMVWYPGGKDKGDTEGREV